MSSAGSLQPCPVCNHSFGAAVFESHVDLCLKQAHMKEATTSGKLLSADELGRSSAHISKELFDFLDNLERADKPTRNDPRMQRTLEHLANTLQNGLMRLQRISPDTHAITPGNDMMLSNNGVVKSPSANGRMGEFRGGEVSGDHSDYSDDGDNEIVKGGGGLQLRRVQNDESDDRHDDALDLVSPVDRRSKTEVKHAEHSGESKDHDHVDPWTSAADAEEATIALLRMENTCHLCNTFQQEMDAIFYNSCEHQICRKCLSSVLKQAVAAIDAGRTLSADALACPVDASCANPIPEWMMKRVLSPDDHEKLLQASLKSFMDNQGNKLVKCPNASCGNAFEPVSGSISSGGQKDAGIDGKPLTQEAKEHRAAFRFRCPQCTTVFCSSCSAVPYHLGYTCERWKAYEEAVHCRFCQTQLTEANTAPNPKSNGGPGIEHVCTNADCLAKRQRSCVKMLRCGHPCLGIRDEKICMPCLQPDCADEKMQKSDDFCNICWVESLEAAPCIRLACGHVFHEQCVRDKIVKRWPGARITFGFLNCPLCKEAVDHPALQNVLAPFTKLRTAVRSKALQRLKFEGLESDKRLTDPESKYFENPQAYAMDRFAYYPCFKCKNPYFGGRRACEDAAREDDGKFKPEDLVCGGCTAGNDKLKCKTHGKDYIEYKCKWCCGVASFFCWGSTHFCADCHRRQETGDYLTKKKQSELPKCPGPDKCPLGVKHPPNGTEFALGCGICRHNSRV